MFMWLAIFIINYISILLSVMFFTLLERKILSYSQKRVGPNKISLGGLVQPLLDGIKLIMNEKSQSYKINKFYFYCGPFIMMTVMFSLWLFPVVLFNFFSMSYYLMYMMACLGLSVYSSLLSGWASNSKYSMIGSIRSLAQTISYELTLIFCLLIVLSPSNSLNLVMFMMLKMSCWGMIIPVFPIWVLNIVAECGRAPFDFIEGESELVSGFNTEFSSSMFALLFVGEYGMIILFSLVSSILFMDLKMLTVLSFFVMLTSFLFLRSSFPRFRYDFLMNLAWMKLLPVSIFYLGFMFLLFS